MPVIDVSKKLFLKELNKDYTDEEFSNLCFEFGIELDDITTERAIREAKGMDTIGSTEEPIYKIEVPANRCDLICFEGLARALNIYLGQQSPPQYHLSGPAHESIHIDSSVDAIRPFVVCAILRDLNFTPHNYATFIELQEKLHQTLCRQRTLASIGTHDLDKVQGPFTYTAEDPTQIQFVPLNMTETMDGYQLMDHLDQNHRQLKNYLPIIRDLPQYPVIRDRDGYILSLPPIINSERTKITLQTKNVFIECTGLDLNKTLAILNIVVTMFSVYCAKPFIVEPVNVIHGDKTTTAYPDWTIRQFKCSVQYINSSIGIDLSPEKIVTLLNRMSFPICDISEDRQLINVEVPPTRMDVMHPCDIMEDVAIAYGYHNLEVINQVTVSVGKQLPINKLSDALRQELAQLGYLEILSFSLTTLEDNYTKLNLKDDQKAVVLSNATGKMQICRTTLLPGLLTSLLQNKTSPLPNYVFEVSDVVYCDTKSDVGASNRRNLAAVYQNNTTAGFEIIHGLLDRIMLLLQVKPSIETGNNNDSLQYKIEPTEHPSFFPGRCAKILLNQEEIGMFGVLHPTVLQNFKLQNPVSALTIDIQRFV